MAFQKCQSESKLDCRSGIPRTAIELDMPNNNFLRGGKLISVFRISRHDLGVHSFGIGTILFVAAILLGLVAFLGIPTSALDASIHARWLADFRDAVLMGDWYPRWLPSSNGGLGSPVFYFYPPLPYWICTLVCGPWMEGSVLPSLLLVGFGISSATAGIFGYAAARSAGATQASALALAALFVVAPNHFGNVMLTRAAYAEHWAYAWLAAILWRFQILDTVLSGDGLKSGSQVWRVVGAVLCLSLAITGLFLTHLLTAMLFLPLLAVVAVTLRWSLVCFLGLAGIFAAALSANYLLPISEFIRHTAGESSILFKGAHLERSFLWPSAPLGDWRIAEDSLGIQIAWTWGLHILLVGFGWFGVYRANRGEGFHRSLPIRFFLACWVCLVMMTPLAQPLYDIVPGLRRIQFAYRFLTPSAAFLLVGFAGLISTRHGSVSRSPAWLMSVLAGVLLMVTFGILRVVYTSQSMSSVDYHDPGAAVIDANGEYLPRGASWSDARIYIVSETSEYGGSRAEVESRGSRIQRFVISTNSEIGAEVVLPLFYFPSWVAVDERDRRVELTQHAGTGLTLCRGLWPTGGSFVLLLERRKTSIEKLGLWITGVSWVTVAFGLVFSRQMIHNRVQ